MGTFKKLFASLAAAMVVASSVPANVFAASYSSEYQAAYDYAFGAGLTTQSTIDGARLYDTATRAEFAKIASVYATDVLGKTPNASASCTFSDLGAIQGSDLVTYVTKACQLGLMGVNTNGVFNPTGIVSRAEAGAVIARMLGLGDGNGTPWYANYLSALQSAGLMNDVSNPTRSIARGDLFIMLSRTEDAGNTPATCQDPMVQLSCALGLAGCPAECSGNSNNNNGGDNTDTPEVKAGDLDISLNSATLANNSQIPQAGTVRFAAVDFDAGSQDVALKSVEVSKVGLATIPSSTRVWFEKDGVRVTGRAAFTSEGKAVLSFAPAFLVKKNATETLDLYVELNASAGEDFQFKSAAVDSTAENVSGKFTTPVLRTVNYTVSTATVASAGVGGTTSATDESVELGSFTVQVNNPGSEVRDAMLKSITLRQTDNADLSNLDNLVLERNGETVSTDYVVNGRDVTFTVNDEIKDATTATYYIKADVTNVDQSTDDYTFQLRLTSDLNIVEKTTAFRLTVSGAPTLQQYSIQGGDITFTRDTSVPLSANYAAGTPSVVLMKGTIKTNVAVTVEDPRVNYLNSMDDDDMYDQFSTIYMSIGGSTFSYSPANGGSNTYADFLGTATINGSANVKIWGTLKDTAPSTVIKLGSLNLASFTTNGLAEYVSNGNTVTSSIGSIEGVSVSVDSSTLNVTKTDGLGNQTVAGGSSEFTVLKLNLSSNQGNGVRVSRFVFATGSTTALALNNTSLTIYVDGAAKQTKQLQNSTVTFDVPSFTVDSTHSHTIEIKATFAEAFNTGTFQLVLSSLNAVDALTSASVSYTTPSSAVFTIQTANATVSASTDPIKAMLFVSPSQAQKLVSFKVKALNDTVTLRNVTFTGAGLGDMGNFKLGVLSADGLTVSSTIDATASSATSVTFTNITTPSIAKDATTTFVLVGDVNGNVSAGSAAVTLTTLDIRGSNGSNVTPSFSAIASNTHAIAEDSMKIVKVSPSSKALSTDALRFDIVASGKDEVTFTGVTFDTILTNYTGTATLKLYRDNTNGINLVGTASVNLGNDSVSVAPSNKNVVQAGDTAHYIVIIEGVSTELNYTPDWNIKMTDMTFNGLTASAYYNVGGALPISESK